MSYDPQARRETPLALQLKPRIRAQGPITVRDYMQACLNDPEHGYYRTQHAIGRDGDFVTAPEISQAFGEVIGLWAAVVWQQMGRPAAFNLVELGPGLGTLMGDLLRAARIVPGFVDAAHVALVEPNPRLVRRQQQRLSAASARLRWHEHAAGIEPGPTILIANEIVDVLAIDQFVRGEAGWQTLGVELAAGDRLAFAPLAEHPLLLLPALTSRARPGDVFERRDTKDLSIAMARLAKGGPLAGLFIDYGHEGPAIGDTLQAVRAQRYEHPLTSPGEADLTAHVDFSAFGDEARSFGFARQGLMTQSDFLGGLGIVQRASRLMASNPAKAGAIEAGVARLLAPGGMGTRFKVMGIRSPELAPLPRLPS